jgi:hypothetical protein
MRAGDGAVSGLIEKGLFWSTRREVLKILKRCCNTFVQESPEAKPLIILVCVALANIIKLCHTSSELNRDGVDWFKIIEEEARIATCQQPDGRKLFTALLECYTSTQIQMLTPFSSVQKKKHPALILNLLHWSRS